MPRFNREVLGVSEYEFSHGHRPRGRGLWGFEVAFEGNQEPKVVWAHGTYTQAKKMATSKAKELGGISIKVLP